MVLAGWVRGFGVVLTVFAALAGSACSEAGRSVVTGEYVEKQKSEPSFGTPTPDPGELLPVNPDETPEVDPPRPPSSMCTTPDACTPCTTDDRCAAIVGQLPTCATARCEQGVCVIGLTEPGCNVPLAKPTSVCGFGGPAGAIVSCDLTLVRSAADLPAVEQLSVGLSYHGGAAQFRGFRVVNCPDCRETYAPPATLPPNGHTVTIHPESPRRWEGEGRVTIMPPEERKTALGEAYYDPRGRMVGNPVLLQAVFELLHPIQVPLWVDLNNARVRGVDGAILEATIERGGIVVSASNDSGTRPCDPANDPNCASTTEAARAAAGGATTRPIDDAAATTAAALCELSGPAGSERDCLIQVARSSKLAAPATALEFTMQYDRALLSPEAVYTQACSADGSCTEQPMNAAQGATTPTGHSLVFSPASPQQWNGRAWAMLVHTTMPTNSITKAYVNDEGELSADPLVAWVRFKLTQDIPSDKPAKVSLSSQGEHSALATDSALRKVPVEVRQGMILIGRAAQ
jgi:hypothetical protein